MGSCIEVVHGSWVELGVGLGGLLCVWMCLGLEGGEALVKARERHNKVLNDCIHSLLI